MALKHGKCINIGNGCKVADGKQIIDIGEGNDFVCPDCGSDLVEVTSQATRKGKLGKPVIIIVVALLVLAIAAFVIVNRIRNSAINKVAGVGLAVVHELTTSKKADSNGKQTSPTTAAPAAPTPRPAAFSADSLDAAFASLADPNTTDATAIAIKQKVLAMFTSPDVEVIPVNEGQKTSTGMTIAKYMESLALTHRKATVVNKSVQEGKISELYINEK